MPEIRESSSSPLVIRLDRENETDLAFTREVFGFEAEERGWFREGDRLYLFPGALSEAFVRKELEAESPTGILDIPPPPLPDGPVSQLFMRMEDGATVTWIRHPSALPDSCRAHWRDHAALFEISGIDPPYTAFTSIHAFAFLEGADGKFRIFAPGGIRWIDYPDRASAISDALDMSLAVGMKIQVIGTPSGGNKIAVMGDKRQLPATLRSLFSVYERMGFIVTSADLGLSVAELEKHALPVAPTTLVPLGVYRRGLPSALVTSDAALECLKAMAEILPGSFPLDRLSVSIQGIGEVGFRLARHLIEEGARLFIAEPNPETRRTLRSEVPEAFRSGRAVFLRDPDEIYDTGSDIFCPCALRDILTPSNLERLKRAGVRIVGGPANNLFPNQAEGPWRYHAAGLPVVPYEGIGAGGVAGVAYSIMTGIFGSCPFSPEEKIRMIRAYVSKVLNWSRRYDLPPQVLSDRLLFRIIRRREVLDYRRADEILARLQRGFVSDNRQREAGLVREYTKNGFFDGEGRFGKEGNGFSGRRPKEGKKRKTNGQKKEET